MSSKRFSAMKDFAFARAKKPKLDISISHGGSGAQSSSSSRSRSPAKMNIVDFWADDEDDVILLATQLAEAEAEGKVDAPSQAKEEVTFSEFQPVQASTSTQQPLTKPTDDMAALFESDDDFDFMAVTMTTEQQITLVPRPPDTAPKPALQTQTNASQSQSTAARRQLAQERQIKFLMERLDVLKKDNSKLQKDLSESHDRTESKNGEVNLLRDELRHVRQQLQASKMEKLSYADQKVAEADRQIQAKDAELKLRNVEYSQLKLRQAKSHNEEKNISYEGDSRPQHLLSLHKLSIQKPQEEQRLGADVHQIFENVGLQSCVKRKQRASLFEMELEQLLLQAAQILQTRERTSSSIHEQVISSVCKVFAEFWSYAHSLELPQNCLLYPYQAHPLSSRSLSLFQPLAMYPQERAIFLRRYLATLSVICRQDKALTRSLLQRKHGAYDLLQIASEAIQCLGFSYELTEHFGLLEACAGLLHSCLMVADSLTPMDSLCDLLKQLVFTRPNIWVFHQLSACVLALASTPRLLNQMCVNSPAECFESDRVRSLYRFSPKSCLMQVYAGLLELCFFSDSSLEPQHFQLLLKTCRNHVRFAYQCFQNPPEFILEMMPSLNDETTEEEAAEETTVTAIANIRGSCSSTLNSDSTCHSTNSAEKSSLTTERNCQCYVKLCLSVVTLVFQMMHQWMLQETKTAADTQQVGEISQVAVHLLTLIFRDYYLTCLFRDSEETTKHYLKLICDWWSEHTKTLGFLRIHERFLQQLQKSHFMLKPFHREANEQNILNDLNEWDRTINNPDDAKVNANLNEIQFDDLVVYYDDFFGELEQWENYVFE